jgi:HD-GYP domain-containing protein (c-di-GMP phosphodiesterase class II)
MKEQVPVEKLACGMFVAELDRPWLETPFLIQGFVIESQEQMAELQRSCKYVFVERSLSLGEEFRAEVADNTATPRARSDSPPQFRSESAVEASKKGLFSSITGILSAAFSSPPRPQAPKAPPPPARPQEPKIIIEEDKPKPEPKVPAAPRDRGISNEERAYLERATDPDASVRIYTEKELAARNGLLRRIARFLGVGGAAERRNSYQSKRRADTPVYADQTRIEEELPLAKEAHEKVQVVVQEVIADLNNNKALDLEKVGDAVNWMVQSVVRNPDGMIWLARLKSVDTYTYDHGLNSAIYLIAFGRHLGLPEDQLQVIGTVGLMLDVGMLKIPRSLLEKRGKLVPAELKLFQNHVAYSIDIISGSKNASPALLGAVAEHHERFDGSGYPNGIKGDEISMLGGMAGLVDSYTAMISTRPYAQPKSVQQALHDLYAARNQLFKAELVEEFIQCVGVFPVGSLVELNTGEVAVVVSQNRSRRLKPRVMLALDSNRQPFQKPIMLELIFDPPTPAGEPYRIVRGLQAGLYDYDPKQTLDILMESN